MAAHSELTSANTNTKRIAESATTITGTAVDGHGRVLRRFNHELPLVLHRENDIGGAAARMLFDDELPAHVAEAAQHGLCFVSSDSDVLLDDFDSMRANYEVLEIPDIPWELAATKYVSTGTGMLGKHTRLCMYLPRVECEYLRFRFSDRARALSAMRSYLWAHHMEEERNVVAFRVPRHTVLGRTDVCVQERNAHTLMRALRCGTDALVQRVEEDFVCTTRVVVDKFDRAPELFEFNSTFEERSNECTVGPAWHAGRNNYPVGILPDCFHGVRVYSWEQLARVMCGTYSESTLVRMPEPLRSYCAERRRYDAGEPAVARQKCLMAQASLSEAQVQQVFRAWYWFHFSPCSQLRAACRTVLYAYMLAGFYPRKVRAYVPSGRNSGRSGIRRQFRSADMRRIYTWENIDPKVRSGICYDLNHNQVRKRQPKYRGKHTAQRVLQGKQVYVPKKRRRTIHQDSVQQALDEIRDGAQSARHCLEGDAEEKAGGAACLTSDDRS